MRIKTTELKNKTNVPEICDCPKIMMENHNSASLNGEYAPISDTANGRKVYKQTQGNYYIHSTGSQWRISSDYKGNRLNAYIDVSRFCSCNDNIHMIPISLSRFSMQTFFWLLNVT